MWDKIEMASSASSSTGWCCWGSYERATLVSAQAGLYEVRFTSDARTRWVTACELLASAPPAQPSMLSRGQPTLVPSEAGDEVYVRATMAAAEAEECTVVLDDGSAAERTVPTSRVRLPLSVSSGIQSCKPLGVGDSVHALRGEWIACEGVERARPGAVTADTTARASALHGHLVRLDLEGASGPLEVRVPRGTVIVEAPPAGGGGDEADAADAVAAPLVAGNPCIVLPSGGGGGGGSGVAREGEIIDVVDGDPTAEIRYSSDGATEKVAIGRVRARHELSYRVLVATGGPARLLEAIAPDGLMCVSRAAAAGGLRGGGGGVAEPSAAALAREGCSPGALPPPSKGRRPPPRRSAVARRRERAAVAAGGRHDRRRRRGRRGRRGRGRRGWRGWRGARAGAAAGPAARGRGAARRRRGRLRGCARRDGRRRRAPSP